MSLTIGVDVGGTGVKASAVDTDTGAMVVQRDRADTPHHADPEALGALIAELIVHIESEIAGSADVIGVGFPGVVQAGVVRTAAHLDSRWIDVDAAGRLGAALGRPVAVVNDADAAGLAEVRLGAAAGQPGVVLMLTLGTGIGSGLFLDGRLAPNTELGHLLVGGHEAETRAAASVRHDKDLSWERWALSVDQYLAELERLLWPDLIVIGGGISSDFDRFGPLLHRRTPIVPARLGNDAGIIGAALWAADHSSQRLRADRATPPATDR
jgi:polyphosphate glucokinase